MTDIMCHILISKLGYRYQIIILSCLGKQKLLWIISERSFGFGTEHWNVDQERKIIAKKSNWQDNVSIKKNMKQFAESNTFFADYKNT